MSVTNVTHEAAGMGIIGRETYKEKLVRKFKEQPLVPIGAALTTVALVTAMVKMRRGESKAMNYWLRARVVAQGFTIAAIVGGSYAYGQTRQQQEATNAAEQEALLANAAKERAEFQERLKAAEEAHAWEVQMAGGSASSPIVSGSTSTSSGKGKGWGGLWGWDKSGEKTEDTKGQAPPPSKADERLTPPPGVSTEPAGTKMVRSPDAGKTASAAPAGTEMVRSPVADENGPSSNKGFWGWIGGGDSSSSSEKK
ncbi:hypothetical protein AcV7_002364 [Taiwanofungus camphoratus]|nr:hypothetical protein AcV7_002364 [Antrodia cinnamomea]